MLSKIQTLSLVFIGLSLISSIAQSEEPPANLDFVGGYFEDGAYKCYREPCFKIHKHSYPSANNINFNPDMWPRWLDIDRNCQKEDIQAIANASLIDVAYARGDECSHVIEGRWKGQYSDQNIEQIGRIDVDYLVSLQEAHEYGGLGWPRSKRALFANTPSNLIIVDVDQKAERDGRSASQWMPPNKSYWCEYIVSREQVARKFELHFPTSEKKFNQKMKTLYCKY